MQARRILAVSPDPAVGSRLAAALAAHGTVDVAAVEAIDARPAALCVLHVARAELAGVQLAAVPAGCPVIAMVPRASLAAIVDVMEAAARVAGVVVAEDFDPRELAAMAARCLAAEPIGLADVLAAGTTVHRTEIADHADKARCMADVAAHVARADVPRRYHEPIEQCLDEMVMNALYDAPVDAHGQRLFAGMPARTRATLRTEQRVAVQFGFDGTRFALAVRDAFGTLERPTVLRYLHKCLHSAQQVDRKASGAGVGLYLMLTASTAVYFTVVPGRATEAVCVFDVRAPAALARFGFIAHPDATARPATRARRLPAAATVRRRRVRRGLATAVAAIVLAAGYVAWPRLFGPQAAELAITTVPPGATLEVDGRVAGHTTDGPLVVRDLAIDRDVPVTARRDGFASTRVVVHTARGANAVTITLPPLPTLALDTTPTDAAVTIDGAASGSTPLRVTSLPAGATVTLGFAKPGYEPATAQVQVPAAGETKRFVQPLERSAAFVKVRFVSSPPGAEVVRAGEAATVDRTYTPAEVFVEAGVEQRFTLIMPRHVPLVIPPFTPARGAEGLEHGGTLVPGATLRIEAAGGGTARVATAPHCAAVPVPGECTLAPGTYAVEYRAPDGTTQQRTVMISTRDTVERFGP